MVWLAGGKSRIRGVKGFAPTRNGIPSLAALYFGIGELPESLLGNLNAARVPRAASPYTPAEKDRRRTERPEHCCVS